MEQKTLKSVDVNVNGRTVTGFPSITGHTDLGGDIITFGAFKKTIDERGNKVKWLWSHDFFSPPVAKIVSIEEVDYKQLPQAIRENFPDANGGLKVAREYFENERADEVFQNVKEGVVDEMSIGFDIVKAEYPDDQGESKSGRKVYRYIKEIKLYECSDLLWGMNDATSNVKSLELILAKYKASKLDESDFKFLEFLFNENKDFFLESFVKVFKNEFEIVEKSDIIKTDASSDIKSTDELLRRIYANSLFLTNVS